MTTCDSTPRWHLNELLTALNLPFQEKDIPVAGISIDTRTLKPGDIYIPMQGERDGHDYIMHAFKKGAVTAFVSPSFDVSSVNGLCIVVPDTLVALQQLGVYNRSKTSAKVVAITGSVGKTTLKEMLGHLLKSFGRTVISKASYNNCWGVPLSLLDLRPDTEFGVFEVGMNHTGEIEPLAHMIQPDIAIVTKLAEAHIGFLGSLEAISVEKGTIFKVLKPQGCALIYGGGACDDILLDASKHAQSKLLDMSNLKSAVVDGITFINTVVGGHALHYALPFAALHHVGNSILALETCDALSIDVVKASKVFATFELPAGRGVTHTISLPHDIKITLIDDAYNANPVSMRAGLLSLDAYKAGNRRVAVLGEMRELGEESPRYHRELLASIQEAEVNLVFCCCEAMLHLYNVLPEKLKGHYANTAAELMEPLISSLQASDVVFIKGSKGSKVSDIVDYLVVRNVKCAF